MSAKERAIAENKNARIETLGTALEQAENRALAYAGQVDALIAENLNNRNTIEELRAKIEAIEALKKGRGEPGPGPEKKPSKAPADRFRNVAYEVRIVMQRRPAGSSEEWENFTAL